MLRLDRRKCFSVALLLIVSLLTACAQEELVGVRDEREGLRYLALLAQHGIPAEISSSNRAGKEVRVITVRSENRPRAIELLSEYGLPEQRTELEPSSAVSSFLPPTPEEQLRSEERAKGDQVVRLLEGLPGVVSARLSVLRTPSNTKRENAKLLLVLRLLPNARVAEAEKSAREVIGQSFDSSYAVEISIPKPRIKEEAIAEELVKLFFPFPFHVPVSEVRSVQLQIYSLFGVGVILALIVGFFIGADIMRRRVLAGKMPKGTYERLQEIARQAELTNRKTKERQRAGTGIPLSKDALSIRDASSRETAVQEGDEQ